MKASASDEVCATKRFGASSDLITLNDDPTHPCPVLSESWKSFWRVGEWNEVRARTTSDPPTITTWVNGEERKMVLNVPVAGAARLFGIQEKRFQLLTSVHAKRINAMREQTVMRLPKS